MIFSLLCMRKLGYKALSHNGSTKSDAWGTIIPPNGFIRHINIMAFIVLQWWQFQRSTVVDLSCPTFEMLGTPGGSAKMTKLDKTLICFSKEI